MRIKVCAIFVRSYIKHGKRYTKPLGYKLTSYTLFPKAIRQSIMFVAMLIYILKIQEEDGFYLIANFIYLVRGSRDKVKQIFYFFYI